MISITSQAENFYNAIGNGINTNNKLAVLFGINPEAASSRARRLRNSGLVHATLTKKQKGQKVFIYSKLKKEYIISERGVRKTSNLIKNKKFSKDILQLKPLDFFLYPGAKFYYSTEPPLLDQK